MTVAREPVTFRPGTCAVSAEAIAGSSVARFTRSSAAAKREPTPRFYGPCQRPVACHPPVLNAPPVKDPTDVYLMRPIAEKVTDLVPNPALAHVRACARLAAAMLETRDFGPVELYVRRYFAMSPCAFDPDNLLNSGK